MLDQTLWRKGTCFAVTELFVIVAGILVALSIYEWRSDMADNRLEREYLEAIRADLASDLNELAEPVLQQRRWPMPINVLLNMFLVAASFDVGFKVNRLLGF